MTPAAARAALAERAVTVRHLRRLLALPGTRLGVVGWPASPPQRLFVRWHYWWQAHLMDCLADAQLRDPQPRRRALMAAMVRGHLLRNGLRPGNSYYDDMAWWALALQRAALPRTGAVVERLARTIAAGWREDPVGGIPWRRGDGYRNTPANGPAAILFARTGRGDLAARVADWIDERLRLADGGLIADGLRVGDDGSTRVDPTVYGYCQGVVLGAELELLRRGSGDPARVHRLVAAVGSALAPGGVLGGHGGGNGGLFAGILARHLAAVAVELPGDADADRRCRRRAAGLVTASAEAAWAASATVDGLPLFGPDWGVPAALPRRGGAGRARGNAEVRSSRDPERDLSVQLSGWMLCEAAALVADQHR